MLSSVYGRFWVGYTWQQALAMVFICGLINILITVTKNSQNDY